MASMAVDPVTILGIDGGFASVGWGIVQWRPVAQTVVHGAHGVIRTKKGPTMPRVAAIARGIEALIQAHQPDELACEAFRNYGKVYWTAVQTLYSIGAFAGLSVAHSRPVAEYSAKECKAGCGAPAGTKDAVKDAVTAALQLPKRVRSEHAADALAVALTHLRTLRAELVVIGKGGVDTFANSERLTRAAV